MKAILTLISAPLLFVGAWLVQLVFLSLYLLFAWMQFGGIYHAFRGHSTIDGVISVFVPPYAWYRGVEFFWHENKVNEEWQKKAVEVVGVLIIKKYSGQPLSGQDESGKGVTLGQLDELRLTKELKKEFIVLPSARKVQVRNDLLLFNSIIRDTGGLLFDDICSSDDKSPDEIVNRYNSDLREKSSKLTLEPLRRLLIDSGTADTLKMQLGSLRERFSSLSNEERDEARNAAADQRSAHFSAIETWIDELMS